MNFKVAFLYGVSSFLLGIALKLILSQYPLKNKLLILIGEVLMGVFSSFLITPNHHHADSDSSLKEKPVWENKGFRKMLEIKFLSFRQNFGDYIYLSLLYASNTMTAILTLHINHITIFSAFRRCLCFCVLIFAIVSRTPVKTKEIPPIIIITVGAFITAPDLQLNNLPGYFLVFLHNFITVAMLEYSRFLKDKTKLSRDESAFNVNFGVILLLILIFGFRCLKGTFEFTEFLPYTTWDFWGLFLSLILIVYFHQYYQFECSIKNSPFIVGVTSIFKDIFITFVGITLFKDVTVNLRLMVGLSLSFAGAFWYSVLVARAKESEAKNPKKESVETPKRGVIITPSARKSDKNV